MANTNADKRHDIIATLSSLWAQHPEMRFCQLIQYIVGDGDPFYMEDKDFAAKLRGRYNEDMFRTLDTEKLAASIVEVGAEAAAPGPGEPMFLNQNLMDALAEVRRYEAY